MGGVGPQPELASQRAQVEALATSVAEPRGSRPASAPSITNADAGYASTLPRRQRLPRGWTERRSRWRNVLRRRHKLESIRAHDHRGYRMRRLLAVSDAGSIIVAAACAFGLDRLTADPTTPSSPLVLAPLGVCLWLTLAGVVGMYHVDEKRLDCSVADEIGQVAQLTAVWTWMLFLIDTLGADGTTPVTPALVLWVVSIPLILIGRAVARRAAQRRSWYTQSALVIGQSGDAERVASLLARHPEYGVSVTRHLALDPGIGDGRVESLIDLVEQSKVDRVIFASSYEGLDERTGALRFLSAEGIKVDLVPGDSEVFRSDASLHFVEGLPFLTLPTTGRPRSASLAKRAIDISIAVFGLVLLSPVFAYAALRIKLDSRGPVFFRQRRVGKDGGDFHVLKFRTMTADADDRKHEVARLNQRTDGMFKIAEDPRITPFGARLRRLSLDELPQLINVLRGEMSLVGPRPLIHAESDLVQEHYLARFDVRPGITGPWQVFGRSDIPFRDMLKLDYAYVTNWSIGDDIKLLVRTVNAMFHGRGAY